MNVIFVKKFDLNLPPSYFGDVLLLCHMIGTGINFSGALSDFNMRLVEAVTLNFRWLVFHSDDEITPDLLKPSLFNIGYRSKSTTTNMGTSLLFG